MTDLTLALHEYLRYEATRSDTGTRFRLVRQLVRL